MIIHWPNARSSADPVDLGAQSDLIGAPEPMSIEAVQAAPNGGYLLSSADQAQRLSVIRPRTQVGALTPAR